MKKKTTTRKKKVTTAKAHKAVATCKDIELNDKLRKRVAKMFAKGRTAAQVSKSVGITQNRANSLQGAWRRGAYDKLLTK